MPALQTAVAAFGAKAKDKLANPAASGNPEDQLRAPFEQLLADCAELAGLPRRDLAAVGESAVADLQTRPDYAITVRRALVGFVELKAPGKGADPRRFRDPHDRAQWEKLQSLPNLLYTDGNEFSLWQNGALVGAVVRLTGDIETSGSQLAAPSGLLALFENFLRWEPIPPRSAQELAHVSARLCRLLRDEVTEQLALKSPALTSLAADWRKLLFPEASDKTFADGYAQAVTFGLLMARAKDIRLAGGFDEVARELAQTSSLIGAALRLLTDNAENQATLKTSLGTLTRVLDAVDWPKIRFLCRNITRPALANELQPDLRLKLSLDRRDALLAALADRQLDLMIGGYPPAEAEVFARHPHCLIAPPDHPLAGRRGLSWADLAHETFVFREPGSATRSPPWATSDRRAQPFMVAAALTMRSSSSPIL